jgi:hypothetical protein
MAYWLILAIFTISTLHAHPVIYQGGWVASSMTQSQFSDNQVMYSFKNDWAIGFNHWRISDENGDFNSNDRYLLKLNHLLYRYNGKKSQANIYLHGGLGLEQNEKEQVLRPESHFLGVDVDWETRLLFVAAKHYNLGSQIQSVEINQIRLGFSPFESSFEELQSWVMLQVMSAPQLSRQLMVTPLIRFFYHNILWEMGASTSGDWLLNLMVHF